jgi:hypothetical protein
MTTFSRAVVCALSLTLLSAVPAAAANRVVDSGDGQGSVSNCGASTAAYFSIFAALTASVAGDKIIICPGSGPYDEQLTITFAVTLTGKLGATLKPVMVMNSTSLTSGNHIAAAILIDEGVTGVKIDTLTIDGGDSQTVGGCASPAGPANPIGVYFRNASGSVTNSVVRNFRRGAGLEGCQDGLGIFAQSSGTGASVVTVTNTSVHDFQKNGITGNGPGTTLTATINKVTGDGPTPSIAQNGIQIGFGADGTVTNNVVSEVVYSQCVNPSDPDPGNPCLNGSSTGILVYDGATSTTASLNTVTTTQTGVYLDASSSTASSNLITRTMQYDGIYLPAGADSNTISNNIITNSDESGIWVDGTLNSVTKNKINETPIGIHAACGNIVPLTGTTRNTFYNVPVETDIETCILSLSGSSEEGHPAANASPVE